MIDLEEMVKTLDTLEDLPTLPTIYVQVSELIKDDNVSVAEVAHVIEMDQAMTSKLLRLVNSSFFGFSRQVTSIRQAIVLLGFSTVQSTVLSVSVFDSFSGKVNHNFNLAEFWKHSIACGILCSSLENKLKTGYKDETFVSGLLHDIGKIILDRYFNDDFARAMEHCRSNYSPFHEAEKAIIGCSHDEIGEYLAEKWKLPYALVESIALHHQPSNFRSEPKLVSLVHVADCFAHKIGCGFSKNPSITEIHPFALEELGIEMQQLPDLIDEMRQVIEQNGDLFGLVD